MNYNAYDTAVMLRINRHILKVNAEYPGETVASKLEIAWAANIEERNLDSTNELGRDADYYFAARKELAASKNFGSKVGKGLLGNVAWPVYNIGKLLASATGNDEATRTDKDKPNAPIGGWSWMNCGVADGLADIGDRVTDLRLHSPLDPDVPHEPRPSGVRRGST